MYIEDGLDDRSNLGYDDLSYTPPKEVKPDTAQFERNIAAGKMICRRCNTTMDIPKTVPWEGTDEWVVVSASPSPRLPIRACLDDHCRACGPSNPPHRKTGNHAQTWHE